MIAQHAFILNSIFILRAVFRHHEHFLRRVILVVCQNGLPILRHSRHYRQFHTFGDRERTIRILRLVIRKVITGHLQILERHIGVRKNGVCHGVQCGRSVLGSDLNTPFTFYQLAEEYYGSIVSHFVREFRITATRLQVIGILLCIRVEALNQHTVRIDRVERVDGQQRAAEGDTVCGFVAQRVFHMYPSHGIFPQHFYLLRYVTLGVGNGRQLFTIRSRVVHRIGLEVRDSHTIDGDAVQLGTCHRYRFKRDCVRIHSACLRFHGDICRTGTVRSGDGHLLTRRFRYCDLRTSLAVQFDGVAQYLGIKAFERITVQIDHIKRRVSRCHDDEGDRIGACSATLSRHCDCVYLALEHAQHTLTCLGLFESNRRNSAHTFRQRDHVGRRIRMEARQSYAVHINIIQVHVTRSSNREVNDIRAACTTLRTNRNLIITGQATDRTDRRGLESRILEGITYCRQNRCSLR